MKILFVITGLGMGGAEQQVTSLADNLSSRGYRVKIAYLLKPAIVLPKSSDVEMVWLGGGKSLLAMLKSYLKLIAAIRLYRPDVVHSHMFHANILARLARLGVAIPRLINTAHSNNEGGSTRMLAYRLTDRLTDVFTNVGCNAVKAFELKKAVPQNRMLVVCNGIDTNHFSFNSVGRDSFRAEHGLSEKKILMAIGRFHKAKDYPNLILALDEVVRYRADVHMLIAGDGELRPVIEKLIGDLKLERHITLLGVRNDIPILLSASDVFVLSSAWEGFGLVVAEAMATERVVVATDCGGVAEVVGDKGFLVQPQNSSALAEAMKNALSLSASEARVRGRAAREQIVSKFSLDSIVDIWLNIYAGKAPTKG